MIVIVSLWRQMIWVYEELGVLANDLVVLIRNHHLRVQIRFLLLLIDFGSHVRRPEVSRSRSITAKSLLKLIWMERVYQGVRVNHDFLECFFIKQLLDHTFVESFASHGKINIV